MKISTRTIMRGLRLYNIAPEDASPKELRQLIITPSEIFVKASFVYRHEQYMLLFGSLVDEESVAELWPDKPDDAMLLANPLDPTESVTPFLGKYLLLFHTPSHKQRLDVFLATNFDSTISRSLWQKYIKAGYVSVNGSVVEVPKTEIEEADDIQVTVPTSETAEQALPILYEDEDVIVLNKPAGVLTHAKGGLSNEQTVADFLRPRTVIATDTDRPGIVHRLDRDTSGVLIGARTERAYDMLQRQFANRQVQKTYIAVVEGTPKLPEAQIDVPIGRNPSAPSTFRADAKGKSAQTTYKVLATDGKTSLVLLKPRTGRTHQLRVHMAHIGAPIVGDRVYGKPAERLLLHAYQLRVSLPSGELKTFTASVPAEIIQRFSGVEL